MKTVLLDPADTVILLLDHQNGLFQTVKDVPLAELRTNTVVLEKVAKPADHGGGCRDRSRSGRGADRR